MFIKNRGLISCGRAVPRSSGGARWAMRASPANGGRVQWQRHFSLVDGIDGLSTDDHQLETIILRTNLLTAVRCCSGRVAERPRPAGRPACRLEHNTTSRCGMRRAIRGRMIELASYIGTINWLRLEDGCALGHQLQAWNSSNHSPWLMIYPHFSSSMTLPPGIESRLAETFTMPAPPPPHRLTGDVFGHEAHYSGVHCIDAPAP